MFPTDRQLFNYMIQELKDSAERRRSRGDKSSLLHKVSQYEKEFNAGLFNLDYIRNFDNIYIDKLMPYYLLSLIFDQLKKYKHIPILPYNRDERRDKNLSILKSCKIYHDVYEKFQYFAFFNVKDSFRLIPKDQDTQDIETVVIPDYREQYILEQWKDIETNTKFVQQNVFNAMLEVSNKISAVAMFQFDDMIFIIPFKKIKSKINSMYKVMNANPIPKIQRLPPIIISQIN